MVKWRSRRPKPAPKSLQEWAEQYPEARVTRRELVRILNAVLATFLPDEDKRDGEAGTPEGGA